MTVTDAEQGRERSGARAGGAPLPDSASCRDFFVSPTPAWKRALDIGFSAVFLALASPAIVLIAAAIKLEDGGSVLFGHERTGLGGRRFTVWKFRTMMEDHGEEQVSKGHPDERWVTAVGGVLRRFALDELPQLYNILRGDMSVVGPRPFQTWDREEDVRSVRGFHVRHAVRPGLTGPAQISLGRDSSFAKYFRYDVHYVRNRSFLLDVRIIATSLWISITGRWPDIRRDG